MSESMCTSGVPPAPLAVPESFEMSCCSQTTASSDSGCWTPSVDISSTYSTTCTSGSGIDSVFASSLEMVSVVAQLGPTPGPGGVSTANSSSSCNVSEQDLVDGKVKHVVDVPVNLAFRELSYTVHRRVRLQRVPRRILRGVSGEVLAGQLTAIMGPSGAGKSSLMDVLSGYTSGGVSGRLLVNGSPRDMRHFRRQSVYIQQDAVLFPQLTVKEAVNMAAALKLGSNGPEAQKTISQTLVSMGLQDQLNTMTARLSGGQLKRLAIALELLNNPSVMFFDEPTSGLDSSTTKQCVALLQGLARQGRTVVCTIHQPSATVFALLDQLFLLVDGQCAYRGSPTSLLPYLSHLGLDCPPYYNPADYAIEVASGDYGDHCAELVRASGNGCREDWTGRAPHLWRSGSSTASPLPDQAVSTSPSAAPCASTTTCWPQRSRRDSSSAISTASAGSISSAGSAPLCSSRIYPTTFWMQFYILLKRTFLRSLRDRMLCHSRLYTHLIMGVLIGVLFLDIGGDAAHVFHNFSLLFFCLMFLMFTALSAMILAFPLEMPVIAREHFNRWYSLKSYFVAVTVADVPLQVVCILAYTVVVYYMTSQPMEPVRFVLFLLMCALVAYVAQSLGLLIGAGMKMQHGVIFGPLAILPFTIFSGYFVHQRDAPAGMRWLFHASYLKYGLEGVMLAVYGNGREPLDCSEDYCHFRRPDKFLAELDLEGGSYWKDAIVLAALGSVLRLGAYFVLKHRLSRFH